MKKLLKRTLEPDLYHYKNGKTPGPNPDMCGDCSGLCGNCSGSKLRGDCSGLCGNCSELSGDLNLCKITPEERKKGLNINELVG